MAEVEFIFRTIRESLKRTRVTGEAVRSCLSQADAKNTGELPRAEFEAVLRSIFGNAVSRADCALLSRSFPGANGGIDYSEFGRQIGGGLSGRRVAIINRAFDKLRNGKPSVSMYTLMSAFNAKNHPRVHAEEISEDQARNIFLTALRDAGYSADGQIQREEFTEYYSDLSAQEPSSDDYFVFMVESIWGVKEASGTRAAAIENPRVAELLRLIRQKLSTQCRHEDRERRLLQVSFQKADLSDGLDGLVGPAVFCQVFEYMNFSNADLELLFTTYSQDGRLAYAPFLDTLYPARVFAR